MSATISKRLAAGLVASGWQAAGKQGRYHVFTKMQPAHSPFTIRRMYVGSNGGLRVQGNPASIALAHTHSIDPRNSFYVTVLAAGTAALALAKQGVSPQAQAALDLF